MYCAAQWVRAFLWVDLPLSKCHSYHLSNLLVGQLVCKQRKALQRAVHCNTVHGVSTPPLWLWVQSWPCCMMHVGRGTCLAVRRTQVGIVVLVDCPQQIVQQVWPLLGAIPLGNRGHSKAHCCAQLAVWIREACQQRGAHRRLLTIFNDRQCTVWRLAGPVLPDVLSEHLQWRDGGH